ncbi:MAG: hypothetical protein ACYC90_13330 [Candidatus Nanopelagicales bacterium]
MSGARDVIGTTTGALVPGRRQTAPRNLGALCTRHHQLKTHAGWQITHTAADGTCTWQSPIGRTYHHHPPDIRGSTPEPDDSG